MLNQLQIIHSPTTYILLALFSLAIGSFLNVIIYRLPLMIQAEWKKECRQILNMSPELNEKINLFFPRSFCPACKAMIPAIHNIPLLSYLFLGGRCRQCKHPISPRYPLVEIFSCLLALLAAWYFDFNLTLVFALLFIWFSISLFFIDLQHQLLPDSLTLGLLWLGLIANTQSLFTSLPDAVLSAACAYLSLWLFIQIFYLCTGKIGMGHGDFKLFAAFGAWFGWTQLPFILLFASLSGILIGIIYLKAKGKTTKNTPIPFGPFLCIAGLVSLFCGKFFINWYLTFLFN